MNESELKSHVSELRNRLDDTAGKGVAHGRADASLMTEDEP